MLEKVKKIYELLYSPILTPYNLLENIKLPNYSYVKYYKNENGLIAEMECALKDSDERATFYYHFDQNDKLERIYMKPDTSNEKKIVFDRRIELESAKYEYILNKLELIKFDAS